MMNMPAARVTDLHTCAMCPPPAGAPILPPCCPTVLVGNLPQARMFDLCVCIPPPPFGPGDMIMSGSPTVLVGSRPASRITDITAKGGVIITGFPTVLIGMVGLAFPKLVMGFGQLILGALTDVANAVWEGVTEGFDVGLINNDWCKFLAVKWTPGVKGEGWLGSFTGKLEFRLFELDGVGSVNLPIIGEVGAAGKFQYYAADVGLSGVNGDDAIDKPLPVIRVEDLEAAFSDVEAAGGRIVRPIFAFPGGRRFHAVDPAGNEFAVYVVEEAKE